MNASPASDKWRGSFYLTALLTERFGIGRSLPLRWSIAVAENHNSPCSAEVRCRSAVIAPLGRELVATRTQEAVKKQVGLRILLFVPTVLRNRPGQLNAVLGSISPVRSKQQHRAS